MDILKLVIGWILTIFVGVLALILLFQIGTNRISLKYLISDDRGYASLSRFQFLVFTFVIAMSLFYLVALKGEYPVIPNQILALLGISGGSYVVSKGIQTSRDVGVAEATKEQPPESTPEDE
jgi:hypothetical protein